MTLLVTMFLSALFLTIYYTEAQPVGEIVHQSTLGVSGTATIVGRAVSNISELTVDGITGVQEDWRELFEEQLENRVKDVEELNEAVGDVAQETITGVRQTATAVEGYVDDSLKDYGRFTNDAVTSGINGAVDAAAASGDLARDVATTFVRVWKDTGNAMGDLAGNVVDNTVQLARDAGSVWRSVTNNAVKALTKYDPNEGIYMDY